MVNSLKKKMLSVKGKNCARIMKDGWDKIGWLLNRRISVFIKMLVFSCFVFSLSIKLEFSQRLEATVWTMLAPSVGSLICLLGVSVCWERNRFLAPKIFKVFFFVLEFSNTGWVFHLNVVTENRQCLCPSKRKAHNRKDRRKRHSTPFPLKDNNYENINRVKVSKSRL